MLKVSLDIVPTLSAGMFSLGNATDKIKSLLVDGQIGLVSPKQSVSEKPKSALDVSNKKLVNILATFFTNESVKERIGSITPYVDNIKGCQLNDGNYCDHNLRTRDGNLGAVRVCWHHDLMIDDNPNIYIEQAYENAVRHGLQRVSVQLHGHVTHVTTVDLCWWAVRNDVYEHLPNSIINTQFKREETSKRLGVRGSKDTNARYTELETPREELKRLSKPVRTLTVDDDPPARYFRRPKAQRWESAKYLAYVRRLPCRCCGKEAGIAHHLIGHGEGKMGAKASDLFVIPLCNEHHQLLHKDVNAWESQYGDQLWHMKEVQKQALEVYGAIA